MQLTSAIFRSSGSAQRLAVRGFVSLEGRSLARLECVGGSAWVSFDGQDRILQSGGRLNLRTTDRVVVQSLGGGSAELLVVRN